MWRSNNSTFSLIIRYITSLGLKKYLVLQWEKLAKLTENKSPPLLYFQNNFSLEMYMFQLKRELEMK
jgi:hypothetical protein